MMRTVLGTSLIATMLMSGCVSHKKYSALLLEKDALQRDYDLLKNVRREKKELLDSMVRLNANNNQISSELEDWKKRFSSLYAANEEQKTQLETLRYQNEQMLQTSSGERDKLQKELNRKLKELDEREKQLRNMETTIKNQSSNLDDVKKNLTANERKIKELTDEIKARDAKMAELKNKVNDALKSFTSAELTIQQRNGKIYVSLSENLLFAKGSSVVGVKGKDALAKLATALAANPESEVTVEGHTDSDGTADNNWTLSTQRAMSVVRLLIAGKVDAKRLTASGRALYVPVAPNDTEVNKAKNRRTEIILSPKLDNLYKMIQDNQ